MGRKKNKWFKKVVNLYRYIFKFDVPFNILIDGNFVATSINKKFEMKEILMKTLGENVHLVIPSCVVKEVSEISDKIPGLMNAISKYKIEECQHPPMSPDNCIKSYIGKKNPKKYFVATQDHFLRLALRKIQAVPLLFFEQNMILIDKPSHATIEASERRENLKEQPKQFEKKVIEKTKDEAKEFMLEEFKKSKYYKDKLEQYKINKLMGRVKRKAKGPNPLSVRKKRMKVSRNDNENQGEENKIEEGKKKRKRKRKNQKSKVEDNKAI